MSKIDEVAAALKTSMPGLARPEILARVALEAMRKPTDGMLSSRYFKATRRDVAVWEMLINAALDGL